jgi:hypothetical protein
MARTRKAPTGRALGQFWRAAFGLSAQPAKRDRYRSEEYRQSGGRKNEEVQRKLILAHVPFST